MLICKNKIWTDSFPQRLYIHEADVPAARLSSLPVNSPQFRNVLLLPSSSSVKRKCFSVLYNLIAVCDNP